MHNVLRSPPHLLTLAGGLIYSLSAKGQHIDEPLSKWLGLIRRKKTPTLFIEWKLPSGYTDDDAQNLFRKAFRRHKRVSSKATCLFPIREVVTIMHPDHVGNEKFIFELLPTLAKAGALGKTFARHFDKTEFELATYTIDILYGAIKAAEKKERDRKSVSRTTSAVK